MRASSAGSSTWSTRAELTVIGNVGDDLEMLGLHVSPDLDSILYALPASPTRSAAGVARTRAGTRSRPWRVSAAVAGSGSATATSGSHLVRTELLRGGDAAHPQRRAQLVGSARPRVTLLPATDDELRTWLETPAGTASTSRVVRRAGASATRSTPCATSARTQRRLRPASSRRSRGRADPDRAEQPVRQHRPDPRRREARGRAPVAQGARRRRQPADRRPRGQGPRRPHARPARRRDEPRARRFLLRAG